MHLRVIIVCVCVCVCVCEVDRERAAKGERKRVDDVLMCSVPEK